MQFPFAETVICLGFFVVYLLEELGERFMVHEHDTNEEKKHQQISNLDDPKSQALLTKENGDVSQSHHHQSSDEEGHHHHGHSHGPVLSDQHSVTAAIRGSLNCCFIILIPISYIANFVYDINRILVGCCPFVSLNIRGHGHWIAVDTQ
jgi:hypothetical protein